MTAGTGLIELDKITAACVGAIVVLCAMICGGCQLGSMDGISDSVATNYYRTTSIMCSWLYPYPYKPEQKGIMSDKDQHILRNFDSNVLTTVAMKGLYLPYLIHCIHCCYQLMDSLHSYKLSADNLSLVKVSFPKSI